MKNFFKSLVVGALLLGSVGCSDMFKEDLYEINNEIDKINQRIDSLCNAVNTNIASLQTIIDVMQDNDYVDSITPIVENGVTIGYEIVFTQSGSVKIYHGEKGETGATGHSPVVGVKQAEDGRWYWTIDGEWMVNAEGKKILAEAIDGEDGAPGADGIPGIDGITPKLKVQDNYWYISYDNGTTWERLGKATGEAGADGDSMFQSVTYNDDYVELVLVDGTVLTIPTWASHMLLVDEIAKINSNISALQAAVEALESNDYVQKVTPVKDNEGKVIGYTLQFAFAGDVTIYHGEDGEKGEDGHTPVIGVKQFEGEWYWTIDGEWLLDEKGNKVPTSGEDGAEGAEGQAGITPELKIEDDYWYVSYDKGQTWTKLGKAKGEDGAAGGDGAAGDAFFKGVDVSDEYYVKFTLADGTEIKIPTWKAHQELADAVAHLNTNVQSMQTIITAIQNNDFVTGTTEIVDPQTNEVIGYKLHFSKSGDIEIYHGKTPNAPEIGIKKHPQYGLCWTYDGEYIKDPSTGKPVALPQDGADAVAPKFKIEDGRWWMSTDGGRSWEDIGQATGDQGATGETGGSGDSFFKSVTEETVKDENGRDVVAYIVMTLADGSEYRVPTAYITDELTKRIAAIEAQFSTISTIVNALQNAEYIKDVVELYEGPALVGYEITFVKYTIGADGKLTETTRKSTIRNGGAGAAGTVVAAQYDEATDTWYWTLDGQPLVDKDGNYVAINGRPGQSGVTPKMQINKDTNEWEVSYDNGKTWESTGVKATGPQGPQGNPGQGGAAGDSFFAGVSKDGDYWVFELVSGEKIMVPTAEAFASLAERVAALEKSAESILSLVNGKKYIESCEPFSNDTGSGYHLVLVSLNAETGEATKEDCFIYNGIAGNTPVVGLRQDEATGDWYWTVDGKDLLVDGKPVKANGPQGIDGPVPSFRIDSTNGHLYVNVNGTETDLGRVVGTNGSAGEAGSSSSIIVTPGEDGQLTIDFIGGDGLTSTIVVPSWEAFVALQEAVSALNTNVETISALVYGHKYVESFKELENGGYEFVVRYYDEAAKEWKTEVHTIDITTADEIGVKMDPEDENYYWTKGGEWLLDAAGNRVMVDGSEERTLEFKSENDGKLYYKYSDETEWTVLDIAVSESVVDSNVVVKEENGKVTVTVLDDAGMILYSFSAPSWEAFEALQGRVIALEEQVTDIYTLIAQLTTNYEALSGDVKTMKDKLAKCKFIGEYEYDAERKGNVIYLVDIDGNKLQNAAGEYETIFIADGEDGEDFDASMLSFTEVDGEYFWTYNGEMLVDAAGKPVKAHGADGRTPEFDLINDELVYRYEGDDEWISLGNVKGSAAAANITVDPSEVPMWIEIEYSYVDEDGKEYVSKIKVPTYHAYEMAMLEIEAIQSNIDLVEEFLNKGKFVADYELEYDENGMIIGCTMTTVEYKLQEDGSYRVFTSEAEFMPSQTMHLEVDENEGVWYLVGYKKGEDGKIEEVRRPLSQSAFTFVPKIAVDKGYIYLAKVSVPGTDYTNTDKWECLGAVVELLGGETGSAQGALKSVEEVDGYICFTFSNGDVLKVPSDAKFQEVLDRLDEVENTVETIQGSIATIKGSLASLSEKIAALEGVQGNYLTSAEFESWKNDARFVQNVTKNGDDWTFVVADGNGNPVKDAAFTVSVEHPISVTTKENGDLYWVINGKEYPVESKPKFQVDPVSGNLQFSIDGSDWTTLESASNAVKVVFTNDPYPTEGEWVEVAAADALWAGIYYSEKNIIWMPTYLNFKNIEGRLAKVEGDVVAIQGSIATINGSLASLSEKITALEGVQGNYLTSADFELWKNDARFVQNVTKNGDVWSFVVADGNGKAIEDAGFDITATHHVSTYEKDGVLYWVINGKETEYPVETKPKFRVTDSGNLEFSFDGKEWTALESASNATVTVKFATAIAEDGTYTSCDAKEALWAGIYYDEDNIIWMPTYLNFKNIEERLVDVEDAVETIQDDIVGLTTSLNALETELAKVKEDQAKYLTSADFEEWKSETQFVKSVVKDGEKLTFEIVNGNGDPVETVEYNVNHPVSTYENKEGELYWVINGKQTAYPVDIKPHFDVDDKGRLMFTFDDPKSETAKWTVLESASNNVVDVVFTNDPYPTEGEWVEVAAADALWAGIYYGEDNIIWMPTYKNFNELVAKVEAIDNSVDALIAIVEENAVITDITPSKNGIGFTATAVKYELNYDEKGNLVKGTDGKYYKVTETTEITYADTAVSIEQDPQTKKWYWVVNGAKTELMGTGFVPQVHTADGYVYVSIAADATTDNLEEGWVKIAQTDNNTVVTYEGTAETGYTIDFGGDQDRITVPSIDMFNAVLKRVSALEGSVDTINTLLTGFNKFVKSVEEIKSEGQLVGIKVVTAEYVNNAWKDQTSYYYDNALVVPKNDNGVWNWHIYQVVKDDNGNFTYTELTTIPIDGTFVPQIKYESGAIYVSTPTSTSDLSTWQKLGNFADVQFGGTSKPTLNVTQDNTTVTFTFGTDAVTVPKYFATPVITFSTDGTNITTFSYTDAAKGEDGYATINFTITGSFVDTPNVRAACEGNWISGTVTCNAPTNNGRTVTGSVEVKPTTAYAADERKGKLSLYVPYYGATGIGQIDLTAAGSTNIGLSSTDRGMQILEKTAEETEATVTFSLDEGGNAPSSSGPCKLAFDFDYTLTNEINENGVRVETGNGFSNTYKANGWLGAGACTYDASTKTYTQKIDLTYNMDTEKSRTAAVIVYSPSGREVTRFVIEQDKLTPQNPDVPVIDNIPITKLVPSGKDAANCYIITGPGRYELPAYKGAYKANQLTDDKKCEGRPIVVWNDNSGNTIEFFQKDLADNKILIDVNPTKTNGRVTGHSGAVSNGNAVVAVKGDDGKILWSWHLWFCANGEPATETYPTSLVNMMDRNIGAGAQGEESPLYYQGGRKDPLYPSNSLYSSASGGSMELAIANPSTFYKEWASSGWAAAKSQHDPCPPGYKIPSTSVWAKEKSEINRLTNMTNDAFLYNTVQPTIIYPYSGYLDENGTMADGMTGGITDKTSSTNIYSPTWAMTTMVNNPDLSRSPRRFRNVKYKLHDLRIFGGVWAEGNSALDYGYGSFGFELVSYSYDVGTYKKLYGSLYRVTWSNSWKDVNTVALGQNGLDQTALNDIYEILNIVNFASTLTTELTYDKGAKSANLGYQVRCVAE